METPPPPGPLADDPPPDPRADSSSLALGVALGLLGVPFGIVAVVLTLGSFIGLADVSGGAGYLGEFLGFVALALVLGGIVAVPVLCFRRGLRRLGQGVLVGYGVLALLFGVCTAVVLSSLSGADFR